MSTHAIKIKQVYRATREITVFVEAEDLDSAIEEVESGSFDTPPFEHPDWSTGWDLQNEEVEAAP